MVTSCRQCKNFNPWALAMVIMEDGKVCKADVWKAEEGMGPEDVDSKLKIAAECEHFVSRAG